MVFIQKPRKLIMFSASASKILKNTVNQQKTQVFFFTIYHSRLTMKITSIPTNFKNSLSYPHRKDFKKRQKTKKSSNLIPKTPEFPSPAPLHTPKQLSKINKLTRCAFKKSKTYPTKYHLSIAQIKLSC